MRVFTEKEVMPFVHAWCAAALFVRFSPHRLCGSVALAQTKAWLQRSEVGLAPHGAAGAAAAAGTAALAVLGIDVDSPCAHFYRALSRRDEAKSIPREFYKKAAAIGLLAASVVRVRGVAPSRSGGRNQL